MIATEDRVELRHAAGAVPLILDALPRADLSFLNLKHGCVSGAHLQPAVLDLASKVNRVVFSADGTKLLAGCGDGLVRLWGCKVGGDRLGAGWELEQTLEKNPTSEAEKRKAEQVMADSWSCTSSVAARTHVQSPRHNS